jgi:EAL domain-containing protein (putative c-di-GMP-specific phosphodiesterase class I)
LVQALVTLAINLGMTVVAEGIESPDQVALLQAVECEFAQGYHFGKPMSADEIAERIREQRDTQASRLAA